MIKVHAKPLVERHRKGGWELVLWTGDAFDHSTPFRKMLADIANTLNHDAPTSVELPSYEALEDDVEGAMKFGSEEIRIYYEHSLSYLALMGDDAGALLKIADRLEPLVALA